MRAYDRELYSCRAEAFQAADDTPTNPSTEPTIGDVISARMGRRQVLRGALGVTAIAAALKAGTFPSTPARADAMGFSFAEIEHGADETHHVAPGHKAKVLIRWGDPVLPGAPAFDPMNQSAAAQAMQFGYNNDYLGYLPLPRGSGRADHGLLVVNHEYTSEEVMFPGLGRQDRQDFVGMTPELVAIEMAAHGGSVLEIRRSASGSWQVVSDSPYARRITASTPMRLTGPAAGHARMKTSADPSGTRVLGTINNCAGGLTPWGTWLTAEENFHGYFQGDIAGWPEAEQVRAKRYGVPGGWYVWGRYERRFDVGHEPNEPNRFGWVVEVDPYDPQSVPRKRTAMGRFRHEGGETVVNGDGRVAVYSGDDNRFDYLYKFVTHGRYDPNDRAANRDLLDSGTLFAARFDADGSMSWLPLEFGTGPLTPKNGFHSQADVLIDARLAADLLGATPMDRPEDVQPNAATGRVYVMLTNNTKRKVGDENPANSRADNTFGHIIELIPPDGDHGALSFRWEILVQCGDPSKPEHAAKWGEGISAHGWFGSPDNAATDHRGRLWISTDQGSAWSKSGTADGLWAMETDGPRRGVGRMFFRVPVGAELCGPHFAPDDRSLFLAVQHPATDGVKGYPGFERDSTFEDPATRWPDFKPDMPPRPSVVVITREDGGPIA